MTTTRTNSTTTIVGSLGDNQENQEEENIYIKNVTNKKVVPKLLSLDEFEQISAFLTKTYFVNLSPSLLSQKISTNWNS